MRTSVVLNSQSGSLRDADGAALADRIRSAFAAAGHEIVSLAPSDRPIDESLSRAVEEDSECLLIGGGDGSVSAAAALAWQHGKVLAVLPGGTMNLYARTLGLPLDLDECVAALATGRVIEADIATADGTPFVHQYSVGIHANAVRLRQGMSYDSKLGKLMATARSFYRAMQHPSAFDAIVERDGDEGERLRLSALSVSNNVFGEGHLPYADDPAGGALGVYRGEPVGFVQTVRMVVDIMVGTVRYNDNVSVDRATRVTLRFPSRSSRRRRRPAALLDGELIPLEEGVELEMHAGELRVLVPAERAADAPAVPS